MKRNHILSSILAALMLVGSTALAGHGSSYGAIMDAISSGNADSIAAELERAEYLPCAACTSPVMELLDNDSYKVREVAAWWLARRPLLMQAARDQSFARMNGSDPKAAEYAADVLGAFKHPNAISALSAGLANSSFPASTHVAMVRAIGIIGHPAGMPAVQSALADSAPETRAEAIRAYDSIRGSRPGTEIVPLLSDGDVFVRRQATASVSPFKLAAARTQLETLAAHDADPLVRRNAVFALWKIGDPASRTVLQTVSTSDSVFYVRSAATIALGTKP